MPEVVEIQDPHNWIPANTQNGQLFVSIEQVAGVVHLNSMDNHIYQLEDSNDWLITTDGYKACNKVAGIQCISPDSLLLPDGKVVSNPFVEFDQATGTAHRFWARHITIGKNVTGKPSIISVTILLDAKIAFAEELSRAIEKNKDAGRYYMEGTLTEEEKKSGIYMLFDGEMGIYGDRSQLEVVVAVQNFINNKRYGDKKAWTMALKTSLQRQPCMPPPKIKATNGFACVLVAAHKSDFDEKDVEAMINEYTRTGTVSGADVVTTTSDISKEGDVEDFKLLSDGGMRF